MWRSAPRWLGGSTDKKEEPASARGTFQIHEPGDSVLRVREASPSRVIGWVASHFFSITRSGANTPFRPQLSFGTS
jgi:hypothetical protein